MLFRSLAALGNERRTRAALEKLARVNAGNNWQFNEWFHGLTGEPMGMSGQSWNAASFLLGAASLEGRVFLDGNSFKAGTGKRK